MRQSRKKRLVGYYHYDDEPPYPESRPQVCAWAADVDNRHRWHHLPHIAGLFPMSAATLNRRVVAEFIETWDGGHNYPGFCLVQVVEEEGRPMRVVRGKAIYLRDHPELKDWWSIHDMAAKNLRAVAMTKISLRSLSKRRT